MSEPTPPPAPVPTPRETGPNSLWRYRVETMTYADLQLGVASVETEWEAFAVLPRDGNNFLVFFRYTRPGPSASPETETAPRAEPSCPPHF